MIARLRQETVDRLAKLSAFRNVFDSRQVQITRPMLPAARVYTTASASNLSINITELRNSIRLVVQVIAWDTNDAANAELVDDLCQAVKDRLLTDGSWMVLFERVLSLDTELENNVEGESRTVIATMTFTIQESEVYQPVIPDWLESAGIKLDVIRPAADPNLKYPGPDGRIEAGADLSLVIKPADGSTVWDDANDPTIWDDDETVWPS